MGNIQLSADDFIIQVVMHVNSTMSGAQIVSSGKNIAVFKGTGSPTSRQLLRHLTVQGRPLDIASRFPTNSPAWWAGPTP